jgi:hypothetical protein
MECEFIAKCRVCIVKQPSLQTQFFANTFQSHSFLHVYPRFLLHILRQEASAATNNRQARFFGNSKSVHSILDAAFSRLWQGGGLCHTRREDAA